MITTACRLFLEPYTYARYHIEEGNQRNFSLISRVSSYALGVLLLIPVINIIALATLKALNCLPRASQPFARNWPRASQPFNRNMFSKVPVESMVQHDPVAASVQINLRNLRKTPWPFDMSAVRQMVESAEPAVQLDEILAQATRIFPNRDPLSVLCNDDGVNLTFAAAKQAISDYYVLYARYTSSDAYHQLVAGELVQLLKGIALAMRDPQIPLEKKQDAWIRLACAAGHCPPRRHSEAMNVYKGLLNQVETVEQIVLEYNQLAKEDLFLAHYSRSREPVMTLNYIRQQVGAELGLDTREVNLQDIYINLHDARSSEHQNFKDTTPEQFKGAFHRVYKPWTLIPIMKQFLNNRMSHNPDVCTQISQFIDNEVRKNGTRAQVDLLPEPYQDGSNYLLTNEGVKFLLVHFGILSPLSSS